MSLDDADIYICHRDLWMTDKERMNAAYYGIHVDDGGNTAKIRLGAGDAWAATQPDASIAAAFGNRFAIPLDFEILTDHVIHVDDGGNTAKIRLGAGDAMAATHPDASIAAAFGNRFAIPLDFEILTDHGPFYQAGLNDRLSFEITFNDYGRVIMLTDLTASYEITNISLEFDVVTNPDLARRKVSSI